MKKASNDNDASLCRENGDYIAVKAQCPRLLESLVLKGKRGITTIECREWLHIMHPAGRVKELRSRGFEIVTLRTLNPNGSTAGIARYVLLRPFKGIGQQPDLFEFHQPERLPQLALQAPVPMAVTGTGIMSDAGRGGYHEFQA